MARLDRNERMKQMIDAGVSIYRAAGIESVSLTSVARCCGVSRGLVARYFVNREKLRRAVRRAGA